MPEKLITRLTWAILPIITFMFSGGPAYAALAADARADEARREQARQALPRDFDDVVGELGAALSQVAAGEGDAVDNVQALFAEIRERDTALRQEFADVEKMIREKGLPDEVLHRHRAFVAKYEERLAAVRQGVADVERGTPLPDGFFERAWVSTKTYFGGDPVREQAAADILELIDSYRPERVQKSFKPEDLPFRRLTPDNARKPKTSAEEWREALKAEEPQASALKKKAIDAATNLLVEPAYAQASDLPTEADLAETIEVQFTPEIEALAAELNNNPVEIFAWVQTNVVSAPTWGSIQGADYCLQTRECNAFDTASLLIALLRVSGIPARYQFGTIEVDEERAKNWLGGFDTLLAAGRYAASAGTPSTLHTRLDGQQTLRLDHVWVRTFLDYLPSQGERSGPGREAIDIDPSFKLYTYQNRSPLSDLTTLDLAQVASDLTNSSDIDPTTGSLRSLDLELIDTTLQTLEADAENSISAIAPGTTNAELNGRRIIATDGLPVLPARLPYPVVAYGPSVASVPVALQHTLTVSLVESGIAGGSNDFVYSAPLAELAGSRITVEFDGASPADVAVADAFLAEWDLERNGFPQVLPTSLLNLIASLKVDGVAVAAGNAMRLGTVRDLVLEFRAPGAPSTEVRNEVNAGEYIAIGLDLARISEQQLAARSAALGELESRIAAVEQDPTTDLRLAEDYRATLFASIVDAWFVNVDQVKDTTYRFVEAAWVRYPSAGTFFSDLAPEPLFGIPWRVRNTGLVMDIDRNLSVSESRVSDPASLTEVTLLQGMAGSALESQVPVAMLDLDPSQVVALATADVLVGALEAGMQLFTLDAQNFSQLQGQIVVDEGTYTDISNAVAAGNTVIVPEAPVFAAGRAITGFVAFDPETGSADYIIGQSFSGAVVAATSTTNVDLSFQLLGSVSGLLFNTATNDVLESSVGANIGFLGKAFGHAKSVMDLILDFAKIYYDPDATGEQKFVAMSVIIFFVCVATLLTAALTALTGPIGAYAIGFLAGYLLDWVKGVLLKRICPTCAFAQ